MSGWLTNRCSTVPVKPHEVTRSDSITRSATTGSKRPVSQTVRMPAASP